MGNWSWKIKQTLQKLMPLAIVGLIIYSGYSLYRHGVFRRGIGQAVSSTLHHIPILGSHFRHYPRYGESPSYAYRPRGHSRGFRRHRRSRRGRHHHHRRHHHR
jgi:hypothetical protein